jgi:hypothetical protein
MRVDFSTVPQKLFRSGAIPTSVELQRTSQEATTQHRLSHDRLVERRQPVHERGSSPGYTAGSPATARLLRDEFVTRFERELPSATACFLDDFEACIAHLRVPIAHRRVVRTTNLLERNSSSPSMSGTTQAFCTTRLLLAFRSTWDSPSHTVTRYE